MFIGWMLHGVYSVHSAVSNKLGERQRAKGEVNIAQSAEDTAHSSGSGVQGPGSREEKNKAKHYE